MLQFGLRLLVKGKRKRTQQCHHDMPAQEERAACRPSHQYFLPKDEHKEKQRKKQDGAARGQGSEDGHYEQRNEGGRRT